VPSIPAAARSQTSSSASNFLSSTSLQQDNHEQGLRDVCYMLQYIDRAQHPTVTSIRQVIAVINRDCACASCEASEQGVHLGRTISGMHRPATASET
jgi:hypothetical protein